MHFLEPTKFHNKRKILLQSDFRVRTWDNELFGRKPLAVTSRDRFRFVPVIKFAHRIQNLRYTYAATFGTRLRHLGKFQLDSDFASEAIGGCF